MDSGKDAEFQLDRRLRVSLVPSGHPCDGGVDPFGIAPSAEAFGGEAFPPGSLHELRLQVTPRDADVWQAHLSILSHSLSPLCSTRAGQQGVDAVQ